MLLYALATFALPDRAAAQPLVEICTTHGIVAVPLADLTGTPDAPAPNAPGPDTTDCPACALAAQGSGHVKAAPPPVIVLPLTAARAATLQPAVSADRPAGVAVSTRRSRGPPLPV